MKDIGSRSGAGRDSVIDAVRIELCEASAAKGAFAYWTHDEATERRRAKRQRTRLRSGKLIGRDDRFLAECQIYDQSAEGVRLRFFANAPVIDDARLYVDRPEGLFDLRIAWRDGREAGARLLRSATSGRIGALQLRALRESYYAMDD